MRNDNNNREWLRTWIERDSDGKKLNESAVQRALDVAESAFHGDVGVGQAARIGVEVVKKEIFKK